MNIAVIQEHFLTGNISENYKKIKQAITKASKENVDLIVFPSFAICGFQPHDLLLYDYFLDDCEKTLLKIVSKVKHIPVLIEVPFRHDNKLFRRVVLIYSGNIKAFKDEPNPQNTSYFESSKYFSKGKHNDIFDIGERKIQYCFSSEIESLKFNSNNSSNVIIIANDRPFEYDKLEDIRKEIIDIAAKTQSPVLFVNAIGGNGKLVYHGESFLVDRYKKITKKAALFEEQIMIADIESKTENLELTPVSIATIHDALVVGIRDYFANNGFKTATLGLSGGIDSAVALPLAVEALGAKNVFGLMMPSQFSSDHSLTDAIKSADNLRVKWTIIPIKNIFDSFNKELQILFENLPFGLTEENIQARIRGSLLMAYANKMNHVLINTSNKSESAVGYGTLYGDLCGGISPLADLYKMQVYELAKYINRKREIIPNNSIDKAPSAELRPNQKDSDSLPDYTVLDQILHKHFELKQGEKEIISSGFDASLVKRTLHLVKNNEYKRQQTPPVLKVSSFTFGIDRKMPI